MNRLSAIVTNPAAGVIATKPTTAPMEAPKAETFLPLIRSKNIQVIIAEAEAMVVVPKAIAAVALAAKAEKEGASSYRVIEARTGDHWHATAELYK